MQEEEEGRLLRKQRSGKMNKEEYLKGKRNYRSLCKVKKE